MTLKPTKSRPQIRCADRPSRDDGRERIIQERSERSGAVGAKIANIWKRAPLQDPDQIDDRLARQRMRACVRLIQNDAEPP